MVTDSTLRVRPREGKATSEVTARNAQGPDADGNFSLTFTGVLATGCHRDVCRRHRRLPVCQNRRAEQRTGEAQLYDGQYRL